MSYGRHRAPRKPRWHDRPRAKLRAAWNWARGEYDEQEDAPWCASPWCSVAPEPHPRQPNCPGGDHRDYVGFYPDEPLTDDNGEPIGDLIDDYEYDDEPQVIRTARVGDTYLPLSGDEPVNPWIPPAFTPDVPRPDLVAGDQGPDNGRPGYLSAFTVPFGADWRREWTPRPAPRPIIQWRPRECGGRITALAGAW